MWTVSVHVGVFWPGYDYTLGHYRFRWHAIVRAWLHLQAFPYRVATVRRETPWT